MSNDWAHLTLHGTEGGLLYEIQSVLELTNGGWVSEGTVLGAAEQDWTATMVAVGGRTNTLFFRARSWADSDGDGLPDWWELEHGLDPNNPDTGDTGVSDGYKDGDGDGWTNLQEYQNGTSPVVFNPPPAPQGLVVTLTHGGAHALLRWPAAPGNLTGYTIERLFDSTVTSVSGSTTSFADTGVVLPTGHYTTVPKYRLWAQYAGGSSVPGPWTWAMESEPPTLRAIRGGAGQIFVAVETIPATAAALEMELWRRSDDDFSWVTVTNVALSVSEIVKRGTAVPEHFLREMDWTTYFSMRWPARWISTNQAASASAWVVPDSRLEPFYDGRAHLKQNLIFLLRAATPYVSLEYDYLLDVPGVELRTLWVERNPTNYAHAGFRELDEHQGNTYYVGVRELQPFERNHLYRNFVLSQNDLDERGYLTTGVGSWYGGVCLWHPPTYQLDAPGSPTNVPALLDPITTKHLCWCDWRFHLVSTWMEESQMITINPVQFTYEMESGARNLFGLQYLSAELVWGADASERTTLLAGGSVPFEYDGRFYLETEQPMFAPAGYYFAQIRGDNYGQTADDFLPGQPAFTGTNPTPLLITALGQPCELAGYAKLAISNGYAGKLGYLEQYFNQALKIDGNGVVTTNETGLLSPYGEFFPTDPGPTALVTMPDLDTNERGTAIVHVVSLNLDVNHDGVMDCSFFGPDQTAATKPFTFWVNNDCDWATYPGYPNFDPGSDKELTLRYSDQFLKDYLNFNPRSVRDLEDYARLWICGVPPLTNGNYSVTLNWANVSGSPAINLLKSVEPDGGMRYLTDANIVGITNIVWQQIDGFIGGHKYQLPTTSTLTLPGAWFTNADNKYLLFEGAGIGSGELVLTIWQGTNVLARTSGWLDLHDVKDFYERANITNTVTGAISNRTSGIHTIQYAAESALGDDQDIIVLVHGINVSDPNWLIASDTVFKRLYWSGYHGRFVTVKWPCDFLWKLIFGVLTTDFTVFNKSEMQAYTAGMALKTYVDQLHTRFPNYRLHLLAHSQGNAITSEAIEAGATFDTYILTQAAMPASSYDVNYAFHTGLSNVEAIYGPTPEWKPMGYRGAYTNMTGRIVNFYNVEDPVLDQWINNHGGAKPNVPATPYRYDGTNDTYEPTFGSSYIVTDPQESRAFVSRSRTLPIGQSGPETSYGVIQSGVNLNSRFGFDDVFPDDHSAQWVWPIQTTRPYFQEVLRSCQIEPAP